MMIFTVLPICFLHYSNTNCVTFSQKTATAVAYCKRGSGLLRVNGRPLDQIEPKVLQYKLQEPLLLLGKVSDAMRSSTSTVITMIIAAHNDED